MPPVQSVRAAGGGSGVLAPSRSVVLFGVVSLFADMVTGTPEAIVGPFRATSGASAAAVGVAAAPGEFIVFGLRSSPGKWSTVDAHHRPG